MNNSDKKMIVERKKGLNWMVKWCYWFESSFAGSRARVLGNKAVVVAIAIHDR